MSAIADPSLRAVAAQDALRQLATVMEDMASLRAEAIRELRRGGMSLGQIAELLGLHRNRVQHLANGD